MLFLVFGSSASGKTAAVDALRRRRPELAIHDFDEIGVPLDADTAWRQRSNERWVRRALGYEADRIDVVLAGETPLGELLATPSAPRLEAISACLLDCDDETRLARLRARRAESPDRSGRDPRVFLGWADWIRRHADDPAWRPDVIRDGGVEAMRWQRWSAWRAGEPRWRVRVVDTSAVRVDDVAGELSAWIDDERRLLRAGLHALACGWAPA